MSQVRLVQPSQTGSEETPTGAQQVPKWLEGSPVLLVHRHVNAHNPDTLEFEIT